MFSWNDQTAQWLTDASDYTGYNNKLSQLLLAHLPCRGSLCDIGCGLGLVDIKLAHEFGSITCVDVSKYAISFILANTAKLGMTNITARVQDGSALEGQWDSVIALFHGSIDNIFRNYLALARDRMIFVTHANARGQTGPEGYRIRKCSDVSSASAWLDSNHISYSLTLESLEFGQPHRSWEDALAFHRTFSNHPPEKELIRHVRETVQETGDPNYPFYTPKQRKFGIFVIHRLENRHFLDLKKG